MLIDLLCDRERPVEHLPPLRRQPDGVHARVLAGALAAQESSGDETPHNIRKRRAVDARTVAEVGLAWILEARDERQDNELPRRKPKICDRLGKILLGALTGPVEQVSGAFGCDE